jgi:DNA-binding XRE family transcriptional regulator
MNKLKRIRLKMGYSQKDMAIALGYSSATIVSGIENGTREMSGVAVKCLEYLEFIFDKNPNALIL